jgi:hypothetical protein
VARGGKSPHGGFSESLAGQRDPPNCLASSEDAPRGQSIRKSRVSRLLRPCCVGSVRSRSWQGRFVRPNRSSWAGAFPERLPGFAPRCRCRWLAARALMEAVRWPPEAAAGGRAGAVVPLRWCDFRLRALPHPCLLPWQQDSAAGLSSSPLRLVQAADAGGRRSRFSSLSHCSSAPLLSLLVLAVVSRRWLRIVSRAAGRGRGVGLTAFPVEGGAKGGLAQRYGPRTALARHASDTCH